MVIPLRRGVLGGTFNPIHLGHLLAAEDARVALALAEVVFVPAGEPWMKMEAGLAPGEDRLRMVLAAIASNPRFRASRVDLDRTGPTYTVDTINDLRRADSGPVDYYFIMGMDALATLPTWNRAELLVEACRFAVLSREDIDRSQVLARLARALPAAPERITFVEGLHVNISATDIRKRCHDRRSIKYRVPEVVERYIHEHGLYR